MVQPGTNKKGEIMDLNIVVLVGRIAAEIERRTFASGAKLLRVLVTVRTEEPTRRVDVIPVTMWDPSDETWNAEYTVGQQVWVSGSVQRRFWADDEGRRSRLEIVAKQITTKQEVTP